METLGDIGDWGTVWGIFFEGGGYTLCVYVRRVVVGSTVDFLVAIYGIEDFFEKKKASKGERIGAAIYNVGEIWML